MQKCQLATGKMVAEKNLVVNVKERGVKLPVRAFDSHRDGELAVTLGEWAPHDSVSP